MEGLVLFTYFETGPHCLVQTDPEVLIEWHSPPSASLMAEAKVHWGVRRLDNFPFLYSQRITLTSRLIKWKGQGPPEASYKDFQN